VGFSPYLPRAFTVEAGNEEFQESFARFQQSESGFMERVYALEGIESIEKTGELHTRDL
jgi:hypothetical protein